MTEYNVENYKVYVEMILTEYPDSGILPSDYESWVAWNEALDRIAEERTWSLDAD